MIFVSLLPGRYLMPPEVQLNVSGSNTQNQKYLEGFKLNLTVVAKIKEA